MTVDTKREEDLKTLFDLPDDLWDKFAERLHNIQKPAPTEGTDDR